MIVLTLPTQTRIENSEKKSKKKIQKIKNHYSGFISSQNGSGQVANERKGKLLFRSFLLDQEQKISKKIAKKYKKLKRTIQASFQAKTVETGREREKKNISFRSFLHDPEQKIPKKREKIFKKLKNTIQASFQAKTGRDRSRKKEKKNSHSKPYYPIQNRKFQKEGQKNSKN